jgi:hypothetical protein
MPNLPKLSGGPNDLALSRWPSSLTQCDELSVRLTVLQIFPRVRADPALKARIEELMYRIVTNQAVLAAIHNEATVPAEEISGRHEIYAQVAMPLRRSTRRKGRFHRG